MEKCNVFIHNHTSSTLLDNSGRYGAAASSSLFFFLSIHILENAARAAAAMDYDDLVHYDSNSSRQHSTIYTKDEEAFFSRKYITKYYRTRTSNETDCLLTCQHIHILYHPSRCRVIILVRLFWHSILGVIYYIYFS